MGMGKVFHPVKDPATGLGALLFFIVYMKILQ